jgi:hypothetical protein
LKELEPFIVRTILLFIPVACLSKTGYRMVNYFLKNLEANGNLNNFWSPI